MEEVTPQELLKQINQLFLDLENSYSQAGYDYLLFKIKYLKHKAKEIKNDCCRNSINL